MKKTILTIALIVAGMSMFACSSGGDGDGTGNGEGTGNGTIIAEENLPTPSKRFISSYFADYSVTEVRKTTVNNYSVLLAPGTTNRAIPTGNYRIDFDSQGNWIEIEARNNSVLPDHILALLPRTILSYVSVNYPNRGLEEIEKETYGYRIELAGNPDVELSFDTTGAFLGNDDDDDDDQIIDAGSLPTLAQEFIGAHFSTLTISRVQMDNDSYDVNFSNGVELEFDRAGNWTDVDVNRNTMPASIMRLLPQAITDYLSANYSSRRVESLENNVSTYKVELSGDVDLIFDKQGNLWGTSHDDDNDNGMGDQQLTLAELPQTIQTFLSTYFSTTRFLFAELDDNEYEVKLADGTELDFNNSGNLISIEVLPGVTIPAGIVNPTITSYVAANYSGRSIEEYSVKAFGFKVELSGYPEIELVFDTQGNFVGYDD